MNEDAVASPAIDVAVFGRSDRGMKRAENQDSFLVANLSRGGAGYRLDSNVEPPPDVGSGRFRLGERGALLIVADGVGGGVAGGVASALAANYIGEHLARTWMAEDAPSAERFATHLRDAVEEANARIVERTREQPEFGGMATTATVAGLFGDRLYLAQVGDSRAYLVRDGVAVQLTRDQSVVQQLVDEGHMTPEQAERAAIRNLVLQALGTKDEIDVVLTHQPLRRGDAIVLCSDGLSGLVRPAEIAAAVAAAEPDAAARRLVELANERGGFDNITAVVARLDGEGLPPARPDDDVRHRLYELPPSAP